MILDFLKKLFHIKDKNKNSLKCESSVDETTKLKSSLPEKNDVNNIAVDDSNIITTENSNESQVADNDELPFGTSYEFKTQELKPDIQKDLQIIEQIPINTSNSNMEEELPFGNVDSLNTTTSMSQVVQSEEIYTPQTITKKEPTVSVEIVDVEVSFDNIQETIPKNDNVLLDTSLENTIQAKNTLEVFCKDNTFFAKGIYSLIDNSLIVISGSTINSNADNFASKHFSYEYRNNPLYVDSNFKVLQDIKFDTSGGAGVFARGKKSNGPIVWKVSNNISLIDYLKQNPYLIDNMVYNNTTKSIIDYIQQNTQIQDNKSFNNSTNKITNWDVIVENGIILHKSTNIEFVNQSIDCLNLSSRAYNSLCRVNIHSIKDLVSMPLDELIKFRQLGINSLNEIIEKTNSYFDEKINQYQGLKKIQMITKVIN